MSDMRALRTSAGALACACSLTDSSVRLLIIAGHPFGGAHHPRSYRLAGEDARQHVGEHTGSDLDLIHALLERGASGIELRFHTPSGYAVGDQPLALPCVQGGLHNARGIEDSRD